MIAFSLKSAIILVAFLAINTFAATHYVDLNSANPTPPYTDWNTAATNIQDAVDAAINSGDLVLVTNGVYATGGRNWFDSGTNRVTLTNSITLQSVNGPAVTFIVGSQVAGAVFALTNAVRCVGMGNNAVLSGFTLTNGEGGWGNYPAGGGVAYIYGNGVGIVTNCILTGNLVTNISYDGGGADRVTLINCQIIGNYAGYGGGAGYCTLIDCVLRNNFAGETGGGAYKSVLINCTVISNSISGITYGGGVSGGSVSNSIIYYNIGGNIVNTKQIGYNCTTPSVGDSLHSLTNEPAFVDLANSDFHLQSNSPCINSGINSAVTSATDLDGNPRIVGGTVDIGAYEYQTPSSILSYAWAQQYGLPTDGSADYADSDGDGMNNWQEWIAGTNPTNSLSLLEMYPPPATNNPTGITVTWQSVSGINYFIQRGSDLSVQPAFSTIQNNIAGQAGTTSYTDTSATNDVPYFYRVGVQ